MSVEGEKQERVGREDRYSSVSAALPKQNSRTRYYKENIDHRPTRREETEVDITTHR